MLKKYMIFVMGIFALLCFCQVDINTKTINDTNEIQNTVIKKGSNKDNDKISSYLEPLIDDMEDDINIPIVKSADSKEDSYENNDSFASASLLSLSYDGTGIATSYSKRISATIHRNEWLWGLWKREADEDYYKIEVYGKGKIVVDLTNIPSDCNYDLELYRYDNICYCEEDSISLISSSNNTGSLSEQITEDILPNVFFIRVFSADGSFNAAEYYKLSFSLQYEYSDVSISNLRYSNGAGAAIWVSDYDPFGIIPFSEIARCEVGYVSHSEFKSVYKMAHPYKYKVKKDGKTLHASLYIWNKEIRKFLYEMTLDCISELKSKLSEDQNLKMTFDVIEEWNNNVVTGISLVATLIPTVGTITKVIKSTAMAVGLTFEPSILGAIFEIICPQNKIDTQKNYINYLTNIAVALECNENTDSKEVVKIDSEYTIDSTSYAGSSQTNYYIDYTPELKTSYLYDEDIIEVHPYNAMFNGTVYPLKNMDDYKKIINKNQYVIEEINTGGNTKVVAETAYLNSLDKGEYHWYNFTAPENGIYSFYTEGSTDTYGELFNKIVPAKQNTGKIISNDDYNINIDRNFRIDYELHKGETIFIRVRGWNWTSTGLYSFKVSKVGDFETKFETINGSCLNYRAEYVDNPEKTKVTLDSGFTFETNRLRCGFIEGEYLTLSAKCKGAGLAYLEMEFSSPIYSCSFNMGLWSEKEKFDSSSNLIFEIKNADGIWTTFDKYLINKLSKNKDELDLYEYCFGQKVYGIRIKASTVAGNSNKNKGRVVLSNIKVEY